MLTKRSFSLLLVILAVLVWGLTSCGPVTAVPTATPESTSTPTRTPTPLKTATPHYVPTATPYRPLDGLATLGEGILPQILYSHDGTKVFLSDGYKVRILSADNQQEIASFEISDDGYAWIDTLSPDDSLMLIHQMMGFQVIEISTQKEIGRGSGGNGSAVGPVFTEDSKYVIYRAADHTTGGPYDAICLVDLTGTETTEEEGQNCYPALNNYRYDVMTNPAVSPNGKMVAAGYAESTQNILYIWDLLNKTILHEIKEQPSRINSVAFSSDGSTLATAGADGLIRLWNPVTGKIKRSIVAFTNDIEYVEFSPDGRQLIVSVADQPTTTYDLATGKMAAVTPEPLDSLSKQMLQDGYMLAGAGSKIRFSPDGKSVAVGHGSLQVWDVETHKLKAALFGKQALEIAGMTYSPDGEHLAVVTQDGDVYAWDLRSGQQEFYVAASTLLGAQVFYAAGAGDLGPGIGAGVFGEQGLAFSPDASQIALCNGTAVEIWDIKTATRVATLAQTKPIKVPTKVSFSADGEVVYAVLNRNQDVAVWNTKTGELIRQLDLPRVDPNAFTATDLQGARFARNNYDKTDYWIEIWNLETGQMTKIQTFKREVEPLRFSADGTFFSALLDHNQLFVWRTDTGQLAYVSEPGFDVGDFALASQGSLLATADYGEVTLWGLQQFTSQALQPGFSSLAMPPTATPWNSGSDYTYPTPNPQPTQVVTLLTVPSMQPGAISPENIVNLKSRGELGQGRVSQIQWSLDGDVAWVTSSQGVYELDRQTLQAAQRFGTEAFWATSSQALPDGRRLVAGFTADGKIQAWETASGKMLINLKGSGEPALSPDGKWLVYVVENGLGTWNLESGQAGTVLRSSYYLSWPVFSPNSQFVAAIQSDRSIRVWDVSTGVIVTSAGGPEADITDLSFSPDGNYLVGAAGGTAWVWSMAPSLSPVKVDLFAGEVKDNLTLFADSVTAVSTNKDNSLLAVGTSQKKILLYNRKTAQPLGNLEGLAGSPVKLAFSPDSAWLLSVDGDGQTILWDVAKRKPVLKAQEFGGKIAGLVARLDGDISAWMNNTVWTFGSQDASLKQTTYISAGKILAASPAGDLVAGYDPLKVSLYDARTGELKQTLPEEAEDVFVEYYFEGDILRQFYGALFSPDGKRLATFGTGGVWMYTSPDGKLINHLEGNNTRKVAFSPDGAWLVASNFENANAPGLIDFSTGDELFNFAFPWNEYSYAEGRVYAQYAVSPDKRWVALLRRGNGGPPRLELVDTTTGLLARTLEFKDASLLSLAFNPSGTLLVIGQADGTVALVDVSTLKILTTLKAHLGPVTALVFSPDGTRLITGSEDGIVKVWGTP